MPKATKVLRKAIVAAIGLPLLIVGIILIPLPGPGLLTCLLAFLILSLEFDWAANHLERSKKELKNIYQKAKDRADRIESLGDKHNKKQK